MLQVVLYGNDANMPEKQAAPRKRERESRSVPVPYQTTDLATPKRVVLESFLDHQVNLELLDWLSINSSVQIRNYPLYRSTAMTNIADLHDPTESMRIAILRFSKVREVGQNILQPFPRREDGCGLASRSFKRQDSVLRWAKQLEQGRASR